VSKITGFTHYQELYCIENKQLHDIIYTLTGIEWAKLDYHPHIESMLLSQIKQKAP
jgi:hypothetical protein